ncbi:MAG: GAF domain-containing protein [Alphaproteobacteria bacterium]|jgi:GAF domain-containing protein
MDSKAREYQSLISKIEALTARESDSIANMANISAVLFNGLIDVNWAGFYIYKDKQLVLGPFQGNPACIRIPIGNGICGKAAQSQQVQVVENVHDFAGHIACDATSNSEVVIPIVKKGQLMGVLDIDSPLVSRFNDVDAEYLSKVVDILIDTMD